MLKLSKEGAQLVFNEIAKPRGPSDRIQAVINMCLKAGAEVPGSEPAVEPEPEPELEPDGVPVAPPNDPDEPEDNVAGEGAVADYGD